MNKAQKILGSGAIILATAFSSAVAADDKAPIIYKPDFKVELVLGKPSGVDIALLGPNQEETTGFYATLDPMHGKPFDLMWNIFYLPVLKDNPYNTDPSLVKHVKDHLIAHGISEDTLEKVYQAAKKQWQQKPELRINSL